MRAHPGYSVALFLAALTVVVLLAAHAVLTTPHEHHDLVSTTVPQHAVASTTTAPAASPICWWGAQQRPATLTALAASRDRAAAERPYPSHLTVALNGFWPNATVKLELISVFAGALSLTLEEVPLDASPGVVFTTTFTPREEALAAVRANPQAAHVFFTIENVDSTRGWHQGWRAFADHLLDDVDVALGFHPASMHPRNASRRGEYTRLPIWVLAATNISSGVLWSALTAPASPARDAEAWSRRPCFASFIATHASYPRAELVRALSELGRGDVLAPGAALHNSTWAPAAEGDKHAFNSRCRFVVTPENSEGAGYVTEKLVDAHLAGAVPVYWGGDGLVADARVFNPARVLTFSEAAGMAALQARVLALDTDPLEREAFFAQPLLVPGAEAATMDLCVRAALAFERALIAAALRSGSHELGACTYPPTLEDAAESGGGAAEPPADAVLPKPPPPPSPGPLALPPGWSAHVSRSSGRTYFFNSASGVSTYDRPS